METANGPRERGWDRAPRRVRLENRSDLGNLRVPSVWHAACNLFSPVAPVLVGPGNGHFDVRRFRHDEEARVDCVWPLRIGLAAWALGCGGAGLRAPRASRTQWALWASSPALRPRGALRPAPASASSSTSCVRGWFSASSRVLRAARGGGAGCVWQSPLFGGHWVPLGSACSAVLRPRRRRLLRAVWRVVKSQRTFRRPADEWGPSSGDCSR